MDVYLFMCKYEVVGKFLQQFFHLFYYRSLSAIAWTETKSKCKILSQVSQTQLLETDPVALTQPNLLLKLEQKF